MKQLLTIFILVSLASFLSADLKAQTSFPKPNYDELSSFLKVTTEALHTYTPDHFNGLEVKSLVEPWIFDAYYRAWQDEISGSQKFQKWEMRKLNPIVHMSDNGEYIEVTIQGRVTTKDEAVSSKETSKEGLLFMDVHRRAASSENTQGFFIGLCGGIETDPEKMKDDWADYPAIKIK